MAAADLLCVLCIETQWLLQNLQCQTLVRALIERQLLAKHSISTLCSGQRTEVRTFIRVQSDGFICVADDGLAKLSTPCDATTASQHGFWYDKRNLLRDPAQQITWDSLKEALEGEFHVIKMCVLMLMSCMT